MSNEDRKQTPLWVPIPYYGYRDLKEWSDASKEFIQAVNDAMPRVAKKTAEYVSK